jgi:excisionase family DNA binding protein
MKELLDTKQACEFLKLTRLTLYRLLKDEELPAFKLGRSWRFERSALEAWIEKKMQESNKTIKQ